MGYIKNNIRWSIQLCDEAMAQFEALYKDNPAEAATIASVLKELNSDPDLEKHLSTQGYKTDDYKVCYVQKFIKIGTYIWRLSINAECHELFTSLDVRLLYYIDYQSKVFKILDFMPRSTDYGENDPKYQERIAGLYRKYNST